MPTRAAIQSMTGYGRATVQTEAGAVTVELRSTNHRYLELEQRLPPALSSLQDRLAELLRGSLRRGRIEVAVTVQSDRLSRRRVALDVGLMRRYYDELIALKGQFGLKGPVTLDHLLSLPQAVSIAEERLPAERFWEAVSKTAHAALRDLVRARQREGTKLVRDITSHLQRIEGHVRAIKRRLPLAFKEQRRRLRDRLHELLGSGEASSSQLEQAAALVRDVDVNEELVRLSSHLSYMRQTLAGGQLVGKRLDFIAQELMREANTTGAKVNDPPATQHVVEIKSCIEKIREQVQNLE